AVATGYDVDALSGRRVLSEDGRAFVAARQQKARPANAKVEASEERSVGDRIPKTFNTEPSALADAEATDGHGFRDAESLRDRAAKAKLERGNRLRSKGIQPEDEPAGFLTDPDNNVQLEVLRSEEEQRRQNRFLEALKAG